MADTTAKLGLHLAGGGSSGQHGADEIADVDTAVNDNLEKLEAAIGFQLVLSTARPSSPYIGMAILETDTLRGYVWDGLTWLQCLDLNQVSGLGGTTAARDAYWGAPGTGTSVSEVTDRVNLANKGARWFNTEKSYEERYFAKVADTGAVAGTVAKTPGWYPSGAGAVPHARTRQKVGSAVNYGSGTSIITTNSGFQEADGAEVGGITFGKLDGTSPGWRFTVPLEGKYRIQARLWPTTPATLLIKNKDVTNTASGVVAAASSGVSQVSGFQPIHLNEVVSLDAGDWLVFGWAAGTAGSLKNDQIHANGMSVEWASVREV